MEIIDVSICKHDLCKNGAIVVRWSDANIGLGELTLEMDDDGILHADTEHMCSEEDKSFMKKVFNALADSIKVDC